MMTGISHDERSGVESGGVVRSAMFLTAGIATRLSPLSHCTPKAALPLMGRPVVHRLLDWAWNVGVRDVAFNLHHLPEAVKAVVGRYEDRRFRFHFSLESPEILLTAGALSPFRKLFGCGGTFLLVNGKITTDMDLTPALYEHRRKGNIATLVATHNRSGEPFSHVRTSADGRLTGFSTCAEAVAAGVLPLAFTGVHILEPEVLSHIPGEGPYDTVRHLYPGLASRGLPVGVVALEGDWREYSTLARYHRHAMELIAQTPSGRFEGPGAECHPASDASKCDLEGGAVVEAGASLRGCILLEGSRAGAEASLTDCLLGPGVHAPPRVRLARTAAAAPAGWPPGEVCPWESALKVEF